MRLFKGMTFGAGMGLITAGASGVANGYSISLITVGVILVLAETGRAAHKRKML
ncbi:MAG: hypothetical protein GXP00_08905 [Alphaproteobacteria bacterium]|nr:hypothetical protein [Alphaproteobacteria bacterium]